MCGIATIFHPSVPKPVDPDRLRAMAGAQASRGPDGGGVWSAPGVGLGHRRLALIDAAGGAQPMVCADGSLAVAFDGAILNHRALRAELAAAGAVFRTGSDAEVILAAWRQWGPGCLARFDGTFAIALYDAGEDSLFLARDRLGVKPLHCALLADGALVAASELKGLLAHPLLRRAASPQAIDDYLTFGFVPDESCLVAGVRKLPAGHFLLVRRGRPVPAPVRWWDIDFTAPARASAAALEEELAAHLRASVAAAMGADVPAGVLLSGSLASASVAALMAEASRAGIEASTLAGAGPEGEGEGARAEALAARFAARHRSRAAPAEPLIVADAIAASFDDPVADPQALTACGAAALARERSRLVLTGTGATLLLDGGGRALAPQERVLALLPGGARRALAAIAAPAAQPRRSAEEAYAATVAVTPAHLRSKLYAPALRRDLQGHCGERRMVEAMQAAPALEATSRAFYAELKIALPGGPLTMLDRASMAVGLEARAPLLDHRLVGFAARLPAARRSASASFRSLLARTMRRHLPSEILAAPAARPPAPFDGWFRGPLAAEAEAMARSPALLGHGWFDETALARLAADHRAGRRDHGALLWQLLMLEKSLARLFGGGTAERRRA